MPPVSLVRVLLISLTILLLGATAPAQATDATALRLKGHSAEAFFDVLSGHGVISTQIYVAVTEGRPATGAARPRPRVIMTIFSAAYGGWQPSPHIDAVGEAELPEGAFVIDRTLNEAHLTTPLRVYDGIDQTALDFALDLTWRATGNAVDERGRSLLETIAFNVRRNLHGDVRPAVATGSIQEPGGYDYLSFCIFGDCLRTPSREAKIMALKNGQVTITRNEY